MRWSIASWCAVFMTTALLLNNITQSIPNQSIKTKVTGISYEQYRQEQNKRNKQAKIERPEL